VLRVGVIGLGVGQQHVAGFRGSGCDVTIVCDLDESRLEAAARQDPSLRTTTEADEVLRDPALDVVSIASYDDAHFAQALAALEQGKHVFVEKPVCRTIAEVRALRAALAERPQLHLASNLVLRAAPLYRWAQEQVRDGLFGSVYSFDGEYLYGRLSKITEGWRGEVENYSVMLGGGVHLVDLMLWLTGQRPASVSAVGNRIATKGSAFRYDDFAAATFAFPSGLVGRVTANFGCVQPHQHVVRIYGTEATFAYDDAGPRLHRSRSPDVPAEPVELAALPGSKADLIPAFVRRIVEGEQSRAAEDELDVISACIAADRALEEGVAGDIEYT
jgi:predicted dehydrogenase